MGVINGAPTACGIHNAGPCARQSATVAANGRHKWRPYGMRNPQRRTLRTAADVGRAVLTSRKTGGFNLFLTGKATFQTILSVTLQRESSAPPEKRQKQETELSNKLNHYSFNPKQT